MKRADLDTRTLCLAVAHYGWGAHFHLAAVYPSEVIVAAMERDIRRRYLCGGVSQFSAFLDNKGRRLVIDAGHSRCLDEQFRFVDGCQLPAPVLSVSADSNTTHNDGDQQ